MTTPSDPASTASARTRILWLAALTIAMGCGAVVYLINAGRSVEYEATAKVALIDRYVDGDLGAAQRALLDRVSDGDVDDVVARLGADSVEFDVPEGLSYLDVVARSSSAEAAQIAATEVAMAIQAAGPVVAPDLEVKIADFDERRVQLDIDLEAAEAEISQLIMQEAATEVRAQQSVGTERLQVDEELLQVQRERFEAVGRRDRIVDESNVVWRELAEASLDRSLVPAQEFVVPASRGAAAETSRSVAAAIATFVAVGALAAAVVWALLPLNRVRP